ncbi:MAG: tetratricopeptide repeat protein, partial [Pseudomonadota bacterium]|nr:tetratricopeptide repeat protein [Pseudomonadota bacterium]
MSALEVIARNTAFQWKGRATDVCDVAKKLGVSHVLEGSVRKSGARVRITAQLIDGRSGGHIWADRFDRDLTDIFAVQDEILRAIVDALKIKLLSEEKQALTQRGTTNVDAYNMYLMARQHWISGVHGDIRKDQAIVRICSQAVAVVPDYAEAWALMSLAQGELRFFHGTSDDALPAAQRALELNPALPEPRCVKARYLECEGKREEASHELEASLRLDPDSWEANREIARLYFRDGRFRDAIPFFEKATDLMAGDYHSPAMLLACYRAPEDQGHRKRAAERALERSQDAIARDPTNATALAMGARALAVVGERDRAKDWAQRAYL